MNAYNDLQRFAAKENWKPEITGVHTKDGKAVATDAFRLVEIETDEQGESRDKYPDYEQLFPEKKDTVILNANYLWELALYMKRHGNKRVELQVNGNDEAVCLYSETPEGKKIRSMVMPIKV